jgi:tellurite resistance protein TerC
VFGLIEITSRHWAGFILCVLAFLVLDLGVFHRRAHVAKFHDALTWTAVWFCLAMGFALLLRPLRSQAEALEFFTGYVVELSLSIDNVFVMALIFSYFHVPTAHQHRVLFCGILGALGMRGAMIASGVALVRRFDWMLYIFGLFLLCTGIRMIFVTAKKVRPEKNIVLRLARKMFPVATELDGQRFTTILGGRFALTPLALALLTVETTDLLFAVDSIPAIFAVTTKPFIVFTSNVFAILGLRSLYSVLAGAIEYFRYFKVGLSLVLVFIGAKMLLDPHKRPTRRFQTAIPTGWSLAVVAGIFLISIALSAIAARPAKHAAR